MEAKQIAKWVALGALFLIPLTPLFVANSFFFPFITGKAFYFRILSEIAIGGWAVLAVADARYRPRFSWVELSVFAFIGWMFVADLFAINVMKAFWSNFERMEGWVLLLHLGFFFVAASSVLRVEKQWRNWFLWSLGVSLILLFHALLQLTGAAQIHQGTVRIDASFGNSTYFAIYLLFNIFIAGWLAFTERRQWLKWSLVALAGVEIVFLFLTETRGTILALVGGIFIATILTALTQTGATRRYAAGGLVAIVIVVGGFVAMRDSAWVKNSELWNRIAHISLADGSARFMIWHMAYQGFLERPVVGWGQEGFNYVFNKYYDPGMYAQEPWFDRAHNAFIDWLMAGGLPAFLLYLSLFVTAIFMLWRSPLPTAERIALSCVIGGYAFHNLFVFDNIYSYVYFFAILALIDSQSQPELPPDKPKDREADQTALFALPVASAVVLVMIFVINISPMQAASGLIQALSPQTAGVTKNLEIFKDLAAHPSFASQEIREQIVSFALQVAGAPNVPDAIKAQTAALAVGEMEKQVKEYPLDAREHLELSLAYRASGNLEGLLKEMEEARKLSPTKEQILLQQGLTLLQVGQFGAAKKALDTAFLLGPQFEELAKFAAIGNIAAGDLAAADAIFKKYPNVKGEVEALLQQLSQAQKAK